MQVTMNLLFFARKSLHKRTQSTRRVYGNKQSYLGVRRITAMQRTARIGLKSLLPRIVQTPALFSQVPAVTLAQIGAAARLPELQKAQRFRPICATLYPDLVPCLIP